MLIPAQDIQKTVQSAGESTGMQTHNRPAFAPAPSRCLAPDLLRIWNVQADRSYDVICHCPESILVTIRTHAGAGVVFLEDGLPIPLPSDSFITLERPRIRRYYCVDSKWVFWWFEYTLAGAFPAAVNTPYCIQSRPADVPLFEDMFVKLQHPSAAERQVASAGFSVLLHRWFAEIRMRREPSPYQRVIEGVIDRIRGDLSADWTLPRLAMAAGLCETLFRREFKRVTGETPSRFILKSRLHAAVLMIQQGVYTLAGIAGQLNFSSAFHLSAAFKKEFGVSPSQWL
ncbi:MAG TPA: hypothetical protein DCS43_11645 [Verrucomicrobia bacterium]|nr:hypothetical protein [Verrucomicrobiota bacterium]